MKNSWSILIWTMFVSLFVVSFFVVYQGSFLNFAKTSEVEWEKIETNISLEETLISLQNNPMPSVKIGKLSLKWSDFDWVSFNKKLNSGQAKPFMITKTWWTNILPLTVNSDWSVKYEVISYDNSLPLSATVYDSWVVNIGSPANIKLDGSRQVNIIWIRAIGSIADFSIQRKTTDLRPPISNYSLYQDFSTWSKFLRNTEVINFDGDGLPIDYKAFSVFLNSINYGK
jgi:hypothetical protein